MGCSDTINNKHFADAFGCRRIFQEVDGHQLTEEELEQDNGVLKAMCTKGFY